MQYTFNPLTNRFDAFATTLSPTGEIDFLTGDSGGAVPPDASQNLNIISGNSVVTAGNVATNSITIKNMADNTKYVVDPRAGETNYQTIQSAINAAYADFLVSALPQTVFIRPATYTENLTLYSNVNLVGDADQPIINGSHLPPASGEILLENIYFTKQGYILYDATTAGTTNITFKNCTFKMTEIDAGNNIVRLYNWTGSINFLSCDDISVQETTIVSVSASANVNIENSNLGYKNSNSGFKCTTTIKNSSINCSCLFYDASVTFIENSYFDKEIKTEDTATVFIVGSYLNTGKMTPIYHTSTGLLTISDTTINTSNASALSGTGTIQLGSVTYIDSSALDPALTLDYTTLFETGSLRLSNTTTGALSAASGVVSAGTLTVGNGGIGTNTLTSHGVLMGNGASAIQATAEPTDGQILIGKTGDFPQLATITAGSGISVTNAAGSITIAATTGRLIQRVYTSSSSEISCTTVIPNDDTIPQQTEGDEVITLAITPTNASNILYIQFQGTGTVTCGASGCIAQTALFQDATANSLAATACFSSAGTEAWAMQALTYTMVAGTTSATTFKIRCGPHITTGGNTIRFNAYSGGRKYGGVSSTTFEIWEIKA